MPFCTPARARATRLPPGTHTRYAHPLYPITVVVVTLLCQLPYARWT